MSADQLNNQTAEAGKTGTAEGAGQQGAGEGAGEATRSGEANKPAEGQQGGQGDEQNKGGAGDGNKPGEGQKPEQKPVEYKFTAPEGKQFASTVIDAYTQVARELSIEPAKAQKILDAVAPALEKHLVDSITAQREEIRARNAETLEKDPDIGGAKLKDTMQNARATLQAVTKAATGDESFFNYLVESDLHDDPRMVRVMHWLHANLSEDVIVNRQGGAGRKTDEEVLFGS